MISSTPIYLSFRVLFLCPVIYYKLVFWRRTVRYVLCSQHIHILSLAGKPQCYSVGCYCWALVLEGTARKRTEPSHGFISINMRLPNTNITPAEPPEITISLCITNRLGIYIRTDTIGYVTHNSCV